MPKTESVVVQQQEKIQLSCGLFQKIKIKNIIHKTKNGQAFFNSVRFIAY